MVYKWEHYLVTSCDTGTVNHIVLCGTGTVNHVVLCDTGTVNHVVLCDTGTVNHVVLCGTGTVNHVVLCGTGTVNHVVLCGTGTVNHVVLCGTLYLKYTEYYVTIMFIAFEVSESNTKIKQKIINFFIMPHKCNCTIYIETYRRLVFRINLQRCPPTSPFKQASLF